MSELTTEQLIKLYNPANASALTPEQLKELQELSSAEIKELARAYPNSTMQRAYLLIIDKMKPQNKQVPALSSFENLWNLRERNGMRNYVAFQFKGNYKPVMISPNKGRRVEVVDLSDEELLVLPGFKKPGLPEPTAEPEKVIVKQVKRSVKQKQ